MFPTNLPTVLQQQQTDGEIEHIYERANEVEDRGRETLTQTSLADSLTTLVLHFIFLCNLPMHRATPFGAKTHCTHLYKIVTTYVNTL